MKITGEQSLLRSDDKKTCPNVADDSLLCQAKIDELKGKWAHQDRNPSLTWRQVTHLLLKTTVERTKPLCLYSRQEKRCLAGE
jgi:hypothetical protein